jgi:hypothetical protein
MVLGANVAGCEYMTQAPPIPQILFQPVASIFAVGTFYIGSGRYPVKVQNSGNIEEN